MTRSHAANIVDGEAAEVALVPLPIRMVLGILAAAVIWVVMTAAAVFPSLIPIAAPVVLVMLAAFLTISPNRLASFVGGAVWTVLVLIWCSLVTSGAACAALDPGVWASILCEAA